MALWDRAKHFYAEILFKLNKKMKKNINIVGLGITVITLILIACQVPNEKASKPNVILIDGGKNQLNFVNSIINKSDHHE